MKLLLDTQLLLWAAGQPDRLSVEAREAIENVHQMCAPKCCEKR
jgi:PIN domain nuclease of toxin-antitoxin system